MAFVAWCCLLMLLVAVSVHGCHVRLQNHCSYGVVVCAQSARDEIYEYIIAPADTNQLDFPACYWPAGAIWRSLTGVCVADGGQAGDASDKNVANVAEFNIIPGLDDSYDLSNVNAYNIGLRILPVNDSQCTAIQCSISDVPAFCDGDNQLQTFSGGFHSCINTDGSQGLGPTDSTRRFKDACPSAYSYDDDDATSTFTCSHGTSYHVTFCPSDG